MAGAAAHYSVYQHLRQKFTDKKILPSPFSNIPNIWVYYFASAIAYFAISIPADVIKTRIQVAPTNMYPNRRIRRVAAQIWRQEGLPGFFRGISPQLLQILPKHILSYHVATFIGSILFFNKYVLIEVKI